MPKAPQNEEKSSQNPAEKQKKTTARASSYDPEKARIICEKLSDGVPLRKICREPGMPAWRTFYDWVARDEELAARVAHARESGFEALAEECLEISDNMVLGTKYIESTDAKGNESFSTSKEDMLGHRKLQIETRLKLLACWSPTRYGNKVQVSGDAENPLKVDANVSLFDAILENLQTKRQLNNAS